MNLCAFTDIVYWKQEEYGQSHDYQNHDKKKTISIFLFTFHLFFIYLFNFQDFRRCFWKQLRGQPGHGSISLYRPPLPALDNLMLTPEVSLQESKLITTIIKVNNNFRLSWYKVWREIMNRENFYDNSYYYRLLFYFFQ